jgi:hypothetical protein
MTTDNYADQFPAVPTRKMILLYFALIVASLVALFILPRAFIAINYMMGDKISLMAKEVEAECLIELKNNPRRFAACIEASNEFVAAYQHARGLKTQTRNY